jgi:hypothetical protein
MNQIEIKNIWISRILLPWISNSIRKQLDIVIDEESARVRQKQFVCTIHDSRLLEGVKTLILERPM